MSQIDASDYSALNDLVDDRSNDELTAAVQERAGGAANVLDKVFAGMAGSFNPDKAAGQQAAVQYEVTSAGDTHEYGMRIADGRCEVARGRVDNPRVTIRAGLPDFLRLVTGKANGMQLFMTGKLRVSGDAFFAQTYQAWFDRPGG